MWIVEPSQRKRFYWSDKDHERYFYFSNGYRYRYSSDLKVIVTVKLLFFGKVTFTVTTDKLTKNVDIGSSQI